MNLLESHLVKDVCDENSRRIGRSIEVQGGTHIDKDRLCTRLQLPAHGLEVMHDIVQGHEDSTSVEEEKQSRMSVSLRARIGSSKTHALHS